MNTCKYLIICKLISCGNWNEKTPKKHMSNSKPDNKGS